jgi:hypothetical protein
MGQGVSSRLVTSLEQMERIQKRMRAVANRKRRDQEFRKDNWIMVTPVD